MRYLAHMKKEKINPGPREVYSSVFNHKMSACSNEVSLDPLTERELNKNINLAGFDYKRR